MFLFQSQCLELSEGSVSFVVVLFVCLFSKALAGETPRERGERERFLLQRSIYSYQGICFCIVCVMTSGCFCFKSKTTEHSEGRSFN